MPNPTILHRERAARPNGAEYLLRNVPDAEELFNAIADLLTEHPSTSQAIAAALREQGREVSTADVARLLWFGAECGVFSKAGRGRYRIGA